MVESKPNIRKCKTCEVEKPFSSKFFYKNKRYRYGFSTECRECTKERSRKWSAENKARKASSDKAYAEKNRQSISEYQSGYRRLNKDKSSAYMKKYAGENAEKLKKSKQNYNSRPEIKMARAERHNERRKHDKKYRLMCNVRSAVSDALSKQSGALRFLEYTIEDLMRHLEKQFAIGMTWENYGSGWHVDHIIPSASFKFEKAEDLDFKFCWSLANLRPLWASENLKKSAKRIFLI